MRQYGIGKTTLYRQLKRLGVELRRSPKSPQVSKHSDEARAHFRRGWEKGRQSGKAPTRGEDGRFICSAGRGLEKDTDRPRPAQVGAAGAAPA